MLIKSALAATVAAALSFAAVPSHAVVWVGIAPPALQVEVTPEARPGYLWVPGYWNWEGRRHVWVAGSWERERPGYAYAPPTWVEEGGRWRFETARWARRDRDHDGVPNAIDRDRDGDGVRNRVDRRPDNPNRR